jgi:hypothetical protein
VGTAEAESLIASTSRPIGRCLWGLGVAAELADQLGRILDLLWEEMKRGFDAEDVPLPSSSVGSGVVQAASDR